ncbi:MAG TPA: shikimate kinase [Chthoniobacteraceae bacterium]|jgi:shikimate kinase
MADVSLPPENVVLIGFMGTGKSSIGRLLAARLRFKFVDTDQMIVEKAGCEIPQIFADHGEAHFRDMETEALSSLAQAERRVVATGGGIVVREENRTLLRALGLVVALTASEDVIFRRVSRNQKRPLLETPNPRETISRMLAARQPQYAEAAQFSVDTSDLTHAEVAEAIMEEARRAFSWQPTR